MSLGLILNWVWLCAHCSGTWGGAQLCAEEKLKQCLILPKLRRFSWLLFIQKTKARRFSFFYCVSRRYSPSCHESHLYTLNKHKHISYLLKEIFASFFSGALKFVHWYVWWNPGVLHYITCSTMGIWDVKNSEIYLSCFSWLSVSFLKVNLFKKPFIQLDVSTDLHCAVMTFKSIKMLSSIVQSKDEPILFLLKNLNTFYVRKETWFLTSEIILAEDHADRVSYLILTCEILMSCTFYNLSTHKIWLVKEGGKKGMNPYIYLQLSGRFSVVYHPLGSDSLQFSFQETFLNWRIPSFICTLLYCQNNPTLD